MYKITRYNKRFNNKTFETYEKARQYIRKWLRKHLDANDNPAITHYGFNVAKG